MAQGSIQQPDLEKQRTAMKKLSFPVGSWSGEAHVHLRANAPATLAQTEEAEFKMGGLLLVIEGIGRCMAGDAPAL